MPIHANNGPILVIWTVLALIKGSHKKGPIFRATKDLFWFTVYLFHLDPTDYLNFHRMFQEHNTSLLC